MHEVIVVEGTKLEKIEYNGQGVISLPMVDRAHKRPEGTAGRTFRKFRERFIFGKDYFDLPFDVWTGLTRRNASSQGGSASVQNAYKGSMVFLTLSGYLMLVKSFTDDLSWQVQRMLVESYFKATTTLAQLKDDLIASQKQVIQLLTSKRGQKYLTDDEKAVIMAMHAEGKGYRKIADAMGRNWTTIRDFIHRVHRAESMQAQHVI